MKRHIIIFSICALFFGCEDKETADNRRVMLENNLSINKESATEVRGLDHSIETIVSHLVSNFEDKTVYLVGSGSNEEVVLIDDCSFEKTVASRKISFMNGFAEVEEVVSFFSKYETNPVHCEYSIKYLYVYTITNIEEKISEELKERMKLLSLGEEFEIKVSIVKNALFADLESKKDNRALGSLIHVYGKNEVRGKHAYVSDDENYYEMEKKHDEYKNLSTEKKLETEPKLNLLK